MKELEQVRNMTDEQLIVMRELIYEEIERRSNGDIESFLTLIEEG